MARKLRIRYPGAHREPMDCGLGHGLGQTVEKSVDRRHASDIQLNFWTAGLQA